MRAVLNMLLTAVISLWFSFRAYFSGLLDPTGDAVIALARKWGAAVSWVTGMKVTLTLAEPLQDDKPYVFMSNHVSAADIWVIYTVLPVRARMIAKKQLGRIPFFGWAMHAGRFIFIDRQNAASARRSIEVATGRIRSGTSVLLFPEGTRSRDGRLGKFKKGGFHLAIGAGVPIVPIAVRGTYELLPPGSLSPRPGHVEVLVGKPIETAGLTDADRDAVSVRVRAAIAAMLGQTGDEGSGAGGDDDVAAGVG